MTRTPLPIDAHLEKIVSSLERGRCLVLEAEPGAGKTTRVPPALLGARWLEGREVLVLEPRRLAAKLAATRVAQELGERLGERVGYQFRFENVSGPATRLRFLTEGMLMRRLLGDPELRRAGCVVLDEFHERHLHTDVAISYLRRLQLGPRPDLRLVVMSATLDVEAVAAFLGDAVRVRAEGRRFDVKVEYLPRPTERGLELLVRDGVTEVAEPGGGHVLVFLPGMGEILRAQSALAGLATERGLDVLPLHGELRREEQDRALGPSRKQKVVLSTNIAESSLTIDGVTAVVDGGLARVASYSSWSGLPSLRTRPISRASAIQRAGRAGRTAPGRCLRLYTRGDYEGRPSHDIPEIARADLAQTVLELRALGIDPGGSPVGDAVAAFRWFEAPPRAAFEAAAELLRRLGALDAAGVVTPLGRRLVELPAHPRLGRLCVEAARLGYGGEGARLAAVLGEGRLERPDLVEEYRKARGDFAVERQRERLAASFRGGAPHSELSGPAALVSTSGAAAGWTREDALAFAVLCAFPDRVARRSARKGDRSDGAELLLASGGTASLEDAALAASAEYFVAADAGEVKGRGARPGRVIARAVASIRPEWLFDLEPLAVTESEELLWEPNRKRLECVKRMQCGQLILSEERGAPGDPEKAAAFLARKIEEVGLREFVDPSEISTLRARVEVVRSHSPDLTLAPLGDAEVAVAVLRWCEGKSSFSELQGEELLDWLRSSLGEGSVVTLNRLAPEWVELPGGRRVRVNYEAGKPPWIESRLQDFFGMSRGPSILGGHVPVTLHLLAPNQRAVQVTSDLAGFWQRAYPEVRKELSRRYPRHSWPESPLTAKPPPPGPGPRRGSHSV